MSGTNSNSVPIITLPGYVPEKQKRQMLVRKEIAPVVADVDNFSSFPYIREAEAEAEAELAQIVDQSLPTGEGEQIDRELNQIRNSSLPTREEEQIDRELNQIRNPQALPQNKVDDIEAELEEITMRSSPVAIEMATYGLNIFNRDGSYSRTGDPNHYYYQADGTIYCKEKGITFVGARQFPDRKDPLPWTYNIAKLRLQTTKNQPLVCTKPGIPGQYYLQPDSSIFYTGDRQSRNPQTFIPGVGWDTSKNTALPIMNQMIKINLKPNSDGAYSAPNDTGKYFYQSNGTLFYTGGTVTEVGVGTSGTGAAVTTTTYRPNTFNGTSWDNTTRLPFDGRPMIHVLGLSKEADGSYKKAGDSGKYFLQSDGSLFYTGISVPDPTTGKTTPAQTFHKGSWDTTRKTPLPGTIPTP